MILAYDAVDVTGRRSKDTLEANDVREAVEQLRRKGLFVTDVQEVSLREAQRKGAVRAGRTRRLPLKVLAPFTRQMAMLLRSGSGLVPALSALQRQMKHPNHAALLGRLVSELEDGSTFNEALRQFPETFDSVYRAIISAGEASGTLAGMFDRLSDIVGKRRALRNKLIGAVAYPALLVVMCGSILSSMIFFVLPRFETMFDDLGVEVPAVTSFLLATGKAATSYWPLLAGGGVVMGGAVAFTAVSDRGRQWVSDMQLAIPGIGRLRGRLIQAQAFRTMGMLLESSVGLLDTLELARGATRNRAFQNMFDAVETTVASGGHPSAAFEASGLVEPFICQAILTGEETGNLGGAMTYCADILDESNEELIKAGVRLLEPLILVCMGVVVGGVAISLFLPLFDMTSALK